MYVDHVRLESVFAGQMPTAQVANDLGDLQVYSADVTVQAPLALEPSGAVGICTPKRGVTLALYLMHHKQVTSQVGRRAANVLTKVALVQAHVVNLSPVLDRLLLRENFLLAHGADPPNNETKQIANKN